MKKILTLFFIFLLPSTLRADIAHDLGNFFDGVGMTSNVTAPHAYQGQQAGYYSGGSLFARNSVRNVQMVQVDLPSFHSGCGGIDLFAGGFSFINNDQLVNLMRNIMNNAKGYALTLALEEVTPQIANVNKFFTDMSNKVNSMNINSCEAAEALVGGVWPRTRQAQQQVCQDVGSNTGVFEDWAKARQGCTTDAFDSTMQKASLNPLYKSMVFDKGNMAWLALKTNPLTNNDLELSEFLMSLSGSIIIHSEGSNAPLHFRVLSSLASDHSLLKAILYGGQATLYHCDETTLCLHPSTHTMTIPEKTSFKHQVESLIEAIHEKIMTDKELNPQEIAFLQSTRIPLYKILNVQAAYQKDASIMDVESYADIIAVDILFQYLQENLHLVHVASQSLHYPEDILKSFQEGIREAMDALRAEKGNAQTHTAMALQLVEQTQAIEQMLAGQLSVHVGSALHWANSLR